MRVSVVLPAFNEGATINERLEALHRMCSARFEEHELIVVDDGSTDDTAMHLQEAFKTVPGLVTERLPSNQGKGAAVRAGVARARMPCCLLVDADLDLSVDAIAEFLDHVDPETVVIASKAHPDSSISGRALSRRALSLGYRTLVGALFRLDVRDTQVGLKWFPTRLLQAAMRKSRVNGFAVDVEVLTIIAAKGARIREAPVRIRCVPHRDSMKVREVSGMFFDTLTIWRESRRRR